MVIINLIEMGNCFDKFVVNFVNLNLKSSNLTMPPSSLSIPVRNFDPLLTYFAYFENRETIDFFVPSVIDCKMDYYNISLPFDNTDVRAVVCLV